LNPRNIDRLPVEVAVGRYGEGLRWMVRDITRRKRAESLLIASEQRYRTLVETAGSVIMAISPHWEIVQWNEEARHVFGCCRSEAIGRDYRDLCLQQEERD